jgi:hypothetical protein
VISGLHVRMVPGALSLSPQRGAGSIPRPIHHLCVSRASRAAERGSGILFVYGSRCGANVGVVGC